MSWFDEVIVTSDKGEGDAFRSKPVRNLPIVAAFHRNIQKDRVKVALGEFRANHFPGMGDR